MQVTRTTDLSRSKGIVYLTDDKTCFNTVDLEEKEQQYVKRLRANEQELIVINRYDRQVFLLFPERCEVDYKTNENCRKLGYQLYQQVEREALEALSIQNSTNIDGGALYLAEGLILSGYKYLRYKKEAEQQKAVLNKIYLDESEVTKEEVNTLQISTTATCIARDLVNDHPAHMTALQMGKEMQRLAKEAGFSVKVFDKKAIEKMGMGGVLAVNRGSQLPPIFGVMEWKPDKPINKKPYVLVGKGIVYDTGGMSLKPTPNAMEFMKCDMAGGANVMATMYAVAKAKLPVHVIGLVPSTDNRPGENAYVPGDVITMHSGQTVEVLNTDAEGRLILADALSYAKQYDPELVLDAATLTGSAARAIGPQGIVFMGTAGANYKKQVVESGEQVYERAVEFPVWEEYDELLESDIADFKNVGGKMAGAITAGKFLQRFTDYPWLHFDIAGVAFAHKQDSYRGKNGTGVGVRLFFDFLSRLADSAT